MILPGVSGGYLLLLLGQYEAILGTIDQLKRGLLGAAATGASSALALVVDALGGVVPLGLGIVVGVVGVSSALRWLLGRFEKATLGALLGLLLGAVVGLWPFREATPPVPGDVVKGRLVTVETFADFDPEDWPLRAFSPTPSHVAGSLTAMAVGLGMTWMIGRLGRETAEEEPKPTS
jgi:putative membrane protein